MSPYDDDTTRDRPALSRYPPHRGNRITTPILGCPPLPSFSPQRESRALSNIQIRGIRRSGPLARFCFARRRGALRILTKSIETRGSRFPLRGERRERGCAPIPNCPSRGKEDIWDALASVCKCDYPARLTVPAVRVGAPSAGLYNCRDGSKNVQLLTVRFLMGRR